MKVRICDIEGPYGYAGSRWICAYRNVTYVSGIYKTTKGAIRAAKRFFKSKKIVFEYQDMYNLDFIV
jgi:hypothetical protein